MRPGLRKSSFMSEQLDAANSHANSEPEEGQVSDSGNNVYDAEQLSETDSNGSISSSDDYSERFSMQRSVLPVAPLNDPNFNKHSAPQTGDEYLRLVRLESLSLPRTKGVHKITSNASVPSQLPSPSQEEELFLSQFKEFKENLPIDDCPVPKLHDNDEDGWFHYLYLREQSYDDCLKETLSLFSQLSDKTLFTLLRYHRKWIIDEWTQITNHVAFAQRIYALLAACQFPFTADEYFNLRVILNELHQKSTDEPKLTDIVNTLRLIICNFYGQRDIT